MKKLLAILSVASILCTVAPASAEIRLPFSARQVWKGSYKCAQGDTNLVLRIRSVSESPVETELGQAYSVSAVFDFDYNNRTAAGAYYVSGRYYPESNSAIFDPAQWIRQPAGYLAVGMDGLVDNDGRYFTGKILFSGCTNFQLRLQS